MNKPINEILVKGIGKKEVALLALEASKDEKFFLELLRVIEVGEKTPAMKATWIIGTSAEKDARLIQKHSSRILEILLADKQSGYMRELIKALVEVQLQEKDEGPFINYCFEQLNRNGIDVAIKYASIKGIEKFLSKYPELKVELISTLESQLDLNTEAWKRYVTRIISRLNKTKRIVQS